MATALLAVGAMTGALAQQTPQGIVSDWTDRQVIFSNPGTFEDAMRSGKFEDWLRIVTDPRFRMQQIRRNVTSAGQMTDSTLDLPDEENGEHRHPQVERDWSASLGSGSGGPISAPAKYVFDVTAPPSCTADFVVTGIDVAGSSTQANIIGFNHLYTNTAGTGLCSGTSPTVIFAYNVGTGVVQSYSAISLDGTKIAFMQNISTSSSRFHVLKFATGTGNGTSATAPASPGSGNSAVDTTVSFAAGSTAAPFVDYADDFAYTTTDSGTASVVHKITGVFKGTPTEVTTGGWPATISGNPGISTPVYDGVSKHVFFMDGTGFLDYVDDSVSPAVVHSGSSGGWGFASTGITATPVLVDSTRGLVYASAGNPNGTSAVYGQADVNLSTASRVTVNVGAASSNPVRAGDFNNAYYSGGASTASFLYVVGNDNTTTQRPALYNIGFNTSFKLNSTTANGPLALSAGSTTGIQASPLTEFFNQPTSTDYLFSGVTNACQTSGVTGGCIRSLNITSAFPTTSNVNNVILAATGGTGEIIIDNYSSSAGASSVYYTTLSGNSIVKATQAGLQ